MEFSWGTTEAKVVEGLVDAIVDVTETGSTIRAHHLRIVHELMQSTPRLIANKESWQDPWKKEKILQIATLLKAALGADRMVGLKMNVPHKKLEEVDRHPSLPERPDGRLSVPERLVFRRSRSPGGSRARTPSPASEEGG